MNRLRLFACLVILLGLGFFPITSHAEESTISPSATIGSGSAVKSGPRATEHKLTFEELGYRFDRKANGVVAQLEYNFPIPRTWEPAKPTINLHFSHSTLLLSDLSGMTVYYNDVPLTDIQLTTENQRDSWLEIQVPDTALRSGQHNLKIALAQRLTREACNDNGAAPGLWTMIHKDSTITFETEQSASLDLAWFPEPFSIYGRKAVQAVDLTVSLPKQPNEAELHAAGLAMAKFGQLAGVRELNLSVRFGDIPAEGHVFVIAQTDRAFDLLQEEEGLPLRLIQEGFITPQSIIVPDDEGVIQLSERPDGSGLLLLSGENDTALTRAALALADSNSLNLMSGQFTIVKETPQQTYAPDPLTESTSLRQLTGVDTQRTQGTSVSQLRYCFQMPHNWVVQPDANLTLNYAYAPTLWAERSSLTVRLNTTTLTTVKLDSEEGGQHQLEVPLATNKLIDGLNCFNFIFTLRMSQSQCTIEFGGEVWAEIEGDSPIYLPHTIANQNDWQPNMAQYPYPFNLDRDLANTTLVLPDAPTVSDIEGALKVAAKFGHDAGHKTLQMEIKTTNSWNHLSDSQDHLILIGDAERNVASAQLQERLLSLSDSNESTMKVRQDLVLHQQSGSAIASAELLDSPWGGDRGILHISGHDESALAALFDLLSANRNEERFTGNIVTVSESGTVRSVDTFNRNKDPVEIEVNAQGVYVQEGDNPTTVRWFLIGGAVLLAQILLTAIGLTIRDRRRQQQLALEVLQLPPSPSDEAANEDDNHSTNADHPPSS